MESGRVGFVGGRHPCQVDCAPVEEYTSKNARAAQAALDRFKNEDRGWEGRGSGRRWGKRVTILKTHL